MRSILGLFVICSLLLQITLGVEEILATDDACFDATKKVTDKTFSPPRNGLISGIKLVHTSGGDGGVSCNGNGLTNWGCDNGVLNFFIEMIEEPPIAKTYYPVSGTAGVTNLAVHECRAAGQGGCGVQLYTLAGYTATSDEIQLINPSYQVTTSQVFSIQFGEGCCDFSTADNRGSACAEVYFLYENYDERFGDYIRVPQLLNFEAANTYCVHNYGTELATIYDEAHAQQLFDIQAKETPKKSYWIGLNDVAEEGKWVYKDGYDCDKYDALGCGGYWLPGQPDNAGGIEDAVELHEAASSTADMLNDLPPTLTRPFLCNALETSCTDIFHKRTTYFGAELIDTTQVYAIDGGTNQRCVFTYIGDNQVFVGAMFESFSLGNKAEMQCAFSYDNCQNEATVNYDDYKWGVPRLTNYYNSVTAPYLFVTCNAEPSMGLIGETKEDFLLAPFNGEFLQNVAFAAKCFETTAVNVRGTYCEDVTLMYWMQANAGMGWHMDSPAQTTGTCGGKGCAFPNTVGSEDNFGFYGNPNGQFGCTASPTSTTNYFVGEVIDNAGCVGSDPYSFDWDVLMEDGVPLADGFDFLVHHDLNVNEEALTLDVEVELRYLGSSSADDNGAVYGTTYVLDFEDFDAHKDDIVLPGTCENRLDTSFTGASFAQEWEYSKNPAGFGQIGTDDYLAYPPPAKWDISMATEDVCGIVRYTASFSWNDLVKCTNHDASRGSYVATTDGTDYLTLSGTFYINVVSPYDYGKDMSFYRVYQILSKPFVIKIAKTVTIISSTGVNLLTMSIIAVYKEDREDTFRLVVLTETADYLILSRDALGTDLDAFTPANGGNLGTADFQALVAAETETYAGEKTGCLDNKANICSQLWSIEALQATCSEDANEVGNKYIDFSGTYQIQFEPKCRTTDITPAEKDYCNLWLNGDIATGGDVEGHKDTITDVTGKVLLSAKLTWKDEICDPEIFNVKFGAKMDFYSDDTYATAAVAPYLFKHEEIIYVEITTSYPDGTYNVFDTKLINVWICTFDPLDEPQEIDAAAGTGGCFAGATPSRDTSVPFYHIFEFEGNTDGTDMLAEGFEDKGHPDETDQTKDQIRFYFKVPGKVTRDKLYVQAQIDVSLIAHDFGDTDVVRRMTLAVGNNAVANQMNHFINHIGVGDGENKPQQPPPNNYYPQEPQPIYNLPAEPSSFVISLSSTWVWILGGLLAVILAFNIVFMCYMNCTKRRRGRASFNRRRRSGYSSVKNVDSEDFNDSEVNAINISE